MKSLKPIPLLCMGAAGIALCAIASLAFGSRSVGMEEIFRALFYGDRSSFNALVVQERIPRTIFSIIAGASLGVSGALMQAITRNPVADPSILGVNTGASLFVVSGIALFRISTAMGHGGATPIKLALAGAATSAALSSLVSAVILPRTDVMNAYRFWQVGSVGGATWEGILAVSPFLAAGLLIGFFIAPALNALALGDDVATGLGVRTGVVRMTGALAGVLLCGATTALAGPIAFVGLMVPHTMRLICGADMKRLIPMSAVGGAMLLTCSDIIGRLIGAPGELEAGIVTAFFGAPILILIARRAKVRSL